MRSIAAGVMFLWSLGAMAAEPLTIGDVQWFGGTYECQGGIRVSIQAVDLPAIPNPMFMMQTKADEPHVEFVLRSGTRTTGGSKLPNGNLSIGSIFTVQPSFDGKLKLGGNDLDCRQVNFQFPLEDKP